MSAMKLTAETLRRLVRESLEEAPIRVPVDPNSGYNMRKTPQQARDSAARGIRSSRKNKDTSNRTGGAREPNGPEHYGSAAKRAGATGVAARNGVTQASTPHLEDDGMDELDQMSSLGEAELDEDMMPPGMHPSVGNRAAPPPLPGKAGGGVPNLKGFKADCNMMADAASRVKQILDAGQGDTKEALRWLGKVVQFAQSAQKNLKN